MPEHEVDVRDPSRRRDDGPLPQRIHALHVGSLRGVPASQALYRRGHGERVDAAMIMFVVEGGEHPVVVDTGVPDPEFVQTWHRYHLDLPAEQRPIAQLERIGIDPETVGTVINTHLHWDHCSNNDLFPNAEIVVQTAELNYAVNPVSPDSVAYELLPGLIPSWVRSMDRIRSVDGETAVMPGVSVIPLPGHTPGSQGVRVEAGGNAYLLTGDAINFYRNWNGDDLAAHIPNGSFVDLIGYMDSFDRMEHSGCEIVPSHDPEVVARGVFE